MYEALEHWKEYQKKKRVKAKAIKEMDKFLNDLINNNGVTKI